MRTGPFTVKVLSNVPSALGCDLHPASSKDVQTASDIQPSLCERVIFRVCRLKAGISGIFGDGAWPSFLSEIYEKAQPEVPRAPGGYVWCWNDQEAEARSFAA
jgi:hypothetical protein